MLPALVIEQQFMILFSCRSASPVSKRYANYPPIIQVNQIPNSCRLYLHYDSDEGLKIAIKSDDQSESIVVFCDFPKYFFYYQTLPSSILQKIYYPILPNRKPYVVFFYPFFFFPFEVPFLGYAMPPLPGSSWVPESPESPSVGDGTSVGTWMLMMLGLWEILKMAHTHT